MYSYSELSCQCSVFLSPFLLYDILLITWSSPFHLNCLVPKLLGATCPSVPVVSLVQSFMGRRWTQVTTPSLTQVSANYLLLFSMAVISVALLLFLCLHKAQKGYLLFKLHLAQHIQEMPVSLPFVTWIAVALWRDMPKVPNRLGDLFFCLPPSLTFFWFRLN